jgi:hypothetical protein
MIEKWIEIIKELVSSVNQITPNGLVALMILLTFFLSSVLGYIIIKVF